MTSLNISNNNLSGISDWIKPPREGLKVGDLVDGKPIVEIYSDGDIKVQDLSGVTAISDAIPTMGALTRLNLSNNEINYNLNGEAAAAPGKALADALAVNTVLKDLDLSINFLKQPFAEAFAVGLSANGALAILNLGHNHIPDDQKANLERICQSKNIDLLL